MNEFIERFKRFYLYYPFMLSRSLETRLRSQVAIARRAP